MYGAEHILVLWIPAIPIPAGMTVLLKHHYNQVDF
jgi:hypothetical protein